MIKIKNVEVVGWEHTIRGMRNPKNSWELSDSISCGNISCDDCKYFIEPDCPGSRYSSGDLMYGEIGPNDHKLMMSLAKGGPVHAKYRRMITVYLDITAPLYWWKEFDTYKVGTVANSCSTMHKIHDKEFTLEDFSCEHLNSEPYDFENNEHIDGEFESNGLVLVSNNDNGWLGHCYHTINGNRCTEYLSPKTLLDKYIISALNANRDAYLKTKDKKYWWQMIQLLPTSYNQKRTIMLNYEVLHNMYFSRKNHKLDEWRELCKWIESLPYSEIITTKETSELDIYKDLIAGKISINEARKQLGLEPIDTTDMLIKDVQLCLNISDEQMNEIIDKINSIPN